MLPVAMIGVGIALLLSELRKANAATTSQSDDVDGEAVVIFSPEKTEAVSEDVEWMTKAIWAEARGESATGQEAVGWVILNRVNSSRYPNTVKSVVLQPRQFSAFNDDDPNRVRAISLSPSERGYDAANSAALRVLRGQVPDHSRGALHYANLDTVAGYFGGRIPATHWIHTATERLKIGRHTFLKGVA